MPPSFEFPNNEELWVPLYNEFPVKPRGDPNAVGPQVMGRLKPGISIDQASAEFVGLAKRMAAENPKTNKQLVSANVQPLLNAFTGPQLRQTVIAMLGDGPGGFADRVRQRDEHAIRPRGIARRGNGHTAAHSVPPAGGWCGKC